MIWTESEEIYLRKLHCECNVLAEYNRLKYVEYNKVNKKFQIPILILSGLNSLFALSLQPFLEQNYISLLNATLSLTCGVLGSIQLFIKINEKIHTYIICSHEFNKLSYKISKEMNIEKEQRCMNGKDYLLEVFNEFNTICDKTELNEREIKRHLDLKL